MAHFSRMVPRLPALLCLFAVLYAHPGWAQSDELTRNYQRGSSLFEAGMFKASTPYFVKALELSEQEYGRERSRTGFILKNLATVYAKQARFEDAEPLYARALRIFENAFGPDHGIVAEVISELSIVYVERKRFIQAEPLLGRVMEQLERNFGPDDSRVAVAAYNYAYASEYLGDANKARTLYAWALEIWQSQTVPDDERIRAVKARLQGLSRVRESKGPSLAPYLPRVLKGGRTPEREALAPAATESQQPEKPAAPAAPPASPSAPPKRPATDIEAGSEKGWRVQLAAFRSRENAETARAALQRSFADLLEPAGDLKIAEASLPKGTYYRVVAGPFAEKGAAAALCRNLKAEKQSCLVARQN